MNKKSNYIIAILLILCAVLIVIIIAKSKSSTFETVVYKTDSGYGYEISYHNKLLIKQDYIPAMQNNVSFCSKEDAQKVADVVREKLKNKNNPSISILELKQLGIKLNCIN